MQKILLQPKTLIELELIVLVLLLQFKKLKKKTFLKANKNDLK